MALPKGAGLILRKRLETEHPPCPIAQSVTDIVFPG